MYPLLPELPRRHEQSCQSNQAVFWIWLLLLLLLLLLLFQKKFW